MNTPVFPLILFSPLDSARLVEDPVQLEQIRLSRWNCQIPEQFAFDAKGTRWHFQFEKPFGKVNFWEEFFDAYIQVSIKWRPIGVYELHELKQAIHLLLDKDDDTLTEFENAPYLKSQLQNCYSFKHVCGLLWKYVYRVDEESLWAEQEKRPQTLT